jgi:NAD(P)-dependent dehydrogenase (short-subunit alcohol dehydrogenase family)
VTGGGTNSIGRSIALRFAREGAKVGVLDINESNAIDPPPEHWDATRNGECLNERNALPEDLAGPAFSLASPDSDFMSGQALVVDGDLYHN